MAHWTLDTIPWDKFDKSKVKPELLSLVKAAAMVEHNGYDYARYLNEVFTDDDEFKETIRIWAEEEVQHGQALRKWAELADPEFDFDKSFDMFTTGYKLPMNVEASVRGSRSGELIARCVVESGTSSYYTAIKEYTDEPALQAVCAKIAADEFRHYKLFYDNLKRYLKKENIGFLTRLRVALGRITESEDDELAYAFYAAHNDSNAPAYDRKTYMKLYLGYACQVYKREHIVRLTAMVFNAVGLKPHGWLHRRFIALTWRVMRLRAFSLKKTPAQQAFESRWHIPAPAL